MMTWLTVSKALAKSTIRHLSSICTTSVNASTRQQEMDNIATWAAANNLKLNISKSKEIVFQNSRRRIAETLPQPLPYISRENVLKILCVTITNHLSASEHIRRIISDSAQSLRTRSSRAATPWYD